MRIKELHASYSENIVTDNFKSRTISCSLVSEIGEGEDIEEASGQLVKGCIGIVRKQVKDYINSMANKNLLVGGKKSQYTILKRKGGQKFWVTEEDLEIRTPKKKGRQRK